MALIDDVRKACTRLAPKGWRTLLLDKHGLDITANDLEDELQRELTIDRDVPGFEDFALEGSKGITPGCPARSLLFHAFASPNVRELNGKELADFPTMAEIESIENYVFGVEPPSMAELSALAAGDLLAIAVFACEYRPAVDTVHRRHADMCYSRTGVARVGTDEPRYDAKARGFVPFVEGDDRALRVLPARYAAYVAVQRTGNETSFGPMRFDFRLRHPELFDRPRTPPPSDQSRKFWVPLHKLFNGDECLRDHPGLEVGLDPHHVNEKIRRVHLELMRQGHDTGATKQDIDQPPFRFTKGIAELSSKKAFGSGLLVPVPRDRLVEPASFKGKPLTFKVPRNRNDFLPTVRISSRRDDTRPAPEYVHARTVPGGPTPNLNDLPNAEKVVGTGGYRALHYVDFTGDGWIDPVCPALNVEVPRLVPAYSLVTAPDFFFTCDQRELMDWWVERAPTALRDVLWSTPPFALSDERIAPNLKLTNVDFTSDPTAPRAEFRPEDDTVTTIVAMPMRGDRQTRPLVPAVDARHTWLPDGAAGVFAPGWDTSVDKTGTVRHLASYGLGSPFPEDSKLCAALSTFWPSVSPDAGRTFSQVFPTISPLTDQEIGSIGSLPWDGVTGPKLVTVGGAKLVEYAAFPFVDYVENALANRFSLALTGRIGTREYTARVLAMARAYRAVGVTGTEEKFEWNVLSFRSVRPDGAEVVAAKTGLRSVTLGDEVFRLELYQPKEVATQPKNHRKRHVGMRKRTVLFVGSTRTLLMSTEGGPFAVATVPF